MPLNAAFVLGPFAVEPDGMINLRLPAARYAFTWRARAVHACLSKTSLALQLGLGRVPSTAHAATARVFLLAAMQTMPGLFPPDWRLLLRPDHRLELAASLPVRWPLSAVDLVAAKTGFLMALGPYLDLLEGAGVADC